MSEVTGMLFILYSVFGDYFLGVCVLVCGQSAYVVVGGGFYDRRRGKSERMTV
jgi:hypothetical protein